MHTGAPHIVKGIRDKDKHKCGDPQGLPKPTIQTIGAPIGCYSP